MPVYDLTKMRGFYADDLGLPIASEHPGRMVALGTGGAMLVLDAGKPRSGPTYLGFRSSDSASLLNYLQARGVRMLLRPEGQH